MQHAHPDDALALSHAGRGWRAAECTLMRAVRLLTCAESGVRSCAWRHKPHGCHKVTQPFYLVYSQYTIQQHTTPSPGSPAVQPY